MTANDPKPESPLKAGVLGELFSRAQLYLVDLIYNNEKLSSEQKRFLSETVKFLVVGSANFVLTFVIFLFMLKAVAANYIVSLWTSWFIGMLFSYSLNHAWVFRADDSIRYAVRFFRFLSSGLLSISINTVALALLVQSTDIDPLIAQFIIMPFIIVFNFLSAKYWSLR